MDLARALRDRTPVLSASFVLAAGLFTIGGAWFIQLVLGVLPCPLCLEQRLPYYVALPVALLALLLASRQAEPRLVGASLAIVAVIFCAGTVLAGYHAGVEWGLWRGPTDCTGPLPSSAGMQDFLKQLQTVKVIRCDEVAMRILGLSLAAWNVIISASIATVAGFGAARALSGR